MVFLRGLSWHQGSGIECILSKLVDDTKFSGAVDITERAGAILRDLHKLEG